MSRIGKQILDIPENVEVKFDNGDFSVKGPKGELSKVFRNEIEVIIKDNKVEFKKRAENRLSKGLWGTYASHAKNMIEGVTKGFEKKLEVNGVGYRAEMQGDKIQLKVGFSHPVLIEVPKGISVSVADNKINIVGANKEDVGQFAAYIRSIKKPEPYKGKGIKYDYEVIRRKQGKKSA